MGKKFVRGAFVPIPEDDARDGITYDSCGKMKYHPDFHFSHGEPYSQEDLEYLCTFFGIDDTRSLSYAIGKTEGTCRKKYKELWESGKVDFYRNSYKQKLEAN